MRRDQFLDDTGEPFGDSRITHVTIGPDGNAKLLPETVRTRANEVITDGTDGFEFTFNTEYSAGSGPTYSDSFEIRRPLIEGSELAYFEEYPRLATIALERYLAEQDVPLAEIENDQHLLRLRQWEWDFNAPVSYGATLDVNATVTDISDERILVAHTFEEKGRALIEGWTEYGCFDGGGEPSAFKEHILEAMSMS